MKRRLLGLAVLGLGLLMYFKVVQSLRPRDRITPENYARIKVGMTEGEVAAILGGPGEFPTCGSGIPRGECYRWWYGDDGTIFVAFRLQFNAPNDFRVTVLRTDYGPPCPREGPGLLHRLWQRIGW